LARYKLLEIGGKAEVAGALKTRLMTDCFGCQHPTHVGFWIGIDGHYAIGSGLKRSATSAKVVHLRPGKSTTRRLPHFLGHASITNSPEPFKDIWR
jgi:hypothetical protein